MQRILIVDTTNLACRAFFATYRGPGQPILSAPGGSPTNAVSTWSNMLATLVVQADPTRVIFGLEGGSGFRKGIHPDYKAHRAPKPDALLKQLPVIESIVRDSGVEFLHSEGAEADDVIMTFAHANRGLKDCEILIASADKDFGQAIGGNVFQTCPLNHGEWNRVDEAALTANLKVLPSQVAAYLAIVGDVSDNIPGIEGLGEGKTPPLLAGNPSLDELAARIAAKKRWPVERATKELNFNLSLTKYRDIPGLATQRGSSPGKVQDVLEQLDCKYAIRVWKRMAERFGPNSAPVPQESESIPALPAPAPKVPVAVQGEMSFA